jgi:hypothetical protein
LETMWKNKGLISKDICVLFLPTFTSIHVKNREPYLLTLPCIFLHFFFPTYFNTRVRWAWHGWHGRHEKCIQKFSWKIRK